ncbi:ketoacyl-synthetase C-terminal extension domain-containing protein [Vibrio sp. PP-XX7]
MMKHKLLIPQINFEKPNDLLRLSDSQLEVNTELKRWDDRDDLRYAAVSSFGLGGTNVHMIVESGEPYYQVSGPGNASLRMFFSSQEERRRI